MTTNHAPVANNNLRPATDYENQELDGMVLAHRRVYRDHLGRIEAARAKHDAFLASLPTEPQERINLARVNLGNVMDINPDEGCGIHEAKALAMALEAFAMNDYSESYPMAQEAMRWIANRLTTCLLSVDAALDRIGYVLEKPENRR